MPFLDKLLDVIAQGVGGLFRPWQIQRVERAITQSARERRLAEAESEISVRVLQISAAEPPRPESPIRLLAGAAVSQEPDDQELEQTTLLERANNRRARQDERRQQNIEDIAYDAYEILNNNIANAAANEEPVADDWISRFFEGAQEVSQPEMQKLWARLLVSEVREPNSVSLRTLEVLRTLSRNEAEAFAATCAFCCSDGSRLFIPSHALDADKISDLIDCRLLTPSGIAFSLRDSDVGFTWEHFGISMTWTVRLEKLNRGLWTVNAYLLSSAGIAIIRALELPQVPSTTMLAKLWEANQRWFDITINSGGELCALSEYLTGHGY